MRVIYSLAALLIALALPLSAGAEPSFPAARTTPAQEMNSPARKTSPATHIQQGAPMEPAFSMHQAAEKTKYSDREFLSAMIMHHEEAIAMADALFAAQGKVDGQVLAWARQIRDSQVQEVEHMQVLISGMGGEEPQVAAQMQHNMAEIAARLRQLPNPARGFVESMIFHHAAALSMSIPALTQSSRPQVAELAENIILVQSPEILAFRRWLATHGA